MAQGRVTARVHVRESGSDSGPLRSLPGANYEETVQALEKVGFRKTADMTAVSVTLDGDVEQRYYLPDTDLRTAATPVLVRQQRFHPHPFEHHDEALMAFPQRPDRFLKLREQQRLKARPVTR